MTFRARLVSTIALAAAGLAIASSAQAAIVTADITGGDALGTGSVVYLGAADLPITLGGDNFNTNNLYILNEQQNVALIADTVLSSGGAGAVTIDAGTIVNSYFFVFDPLLGGTSINAKITFDSNILGIARMPDRLAATDYLTVPGVTFNPVTAYSLESTDVANVGPIGTLTLNLQAGSPGDVYRVITAGSAVRAVPEPASWALMIAGLGFAGAAMRRRSRPAVRFA